METPKPRKTDVLIIGAGMAGLSAAAAVQRAGREVLVIDKGRGIGGRMATRRIGGATFDHGAQFVTARSARFAQVLEKARSAGAAIEWCKGFAGHPDGHTRWRGVPGMTGLARNLANGLEVVREKQVACLRQREGGWVVELADGQSWTARAVVLTAPMPQALVLLEKGGVMLSAAMMGRLSAIQYERCLALMAVLDGPSGMEAPGGFAPAEGPVAWMADNQLKGVSAEPALTVHGTNAFSVAHWDADRDEAGRLLLEAVAPWIGSGVKSFQVHGWRFSKPVQTDPEACAVVSRGPPLVLAGDGFLGSRVESAVLSGWAAAAAVLEAGANHSLAD